MKEHVSARRRGTAIVETEHGVLVVAGRSAVFILPGGGANPGESRTHAAMRELAEETGLKALHVKFLFRHEGKIHKSNGHGYFQDHHTVCLIHALGTPHPRHEVKHVGYFRAGSRIHISGTTREIIERYYATRNNRP